MLRGFDLQLPFFNALWRRVLLTALIAGWTAVELLGGNTVWALLFGALGLWAFWSFFVIWKGPYTDPKA